MEDSACCDHRIRPCLGNNTTGSDEEESEIEGGGGGGRWQGEERELRGKGKGNERTRRVVISGSVCTCYGSGDDVSWRWLRHCRSSSALWCILFVLLISSTAAAQLRPDTDIVGHTENGVCQSQDIRNSVDQFSQLRGCRVIEGFLQIVLIDKAEEYEYANLSFPELREITGYLLLYRVNNLRSLSKLFPNLTVIRGYELFFDYALVVFEMLHLQELGLTSLTDILRGGVYFVKNPMLCYIDTIDWDLIARQAPKGPDAKKEEIHFIRNNKPKNECPICSTSKKCPVSALTNEPLCWNGQECQKVCPAHCEQRTCNSKGECCHDHCIGGCNGTGPDSCLACRGVLFQNKCLERCPSNIYEYLNRRCIEESECQNMPKPRQITSDELRLKPWKPFNGKCILQCPPGYLEVLKDDKKNHYTCEPCKGYCKKECPGASVDSIASAQKLRDCTYIKGSLEIQIRGGINVVKELEDNLKMIEEIHGYLKIVRSFPLVSLNFLKKLKVIHGVKLESGKYSLVVLDNQNLVELWDWDNRGTNFKIMAGKLFFHFNPKLCLYKIDRLKQVANLSDYTDLEVARSSNGDKVACNVTELQATVYKTSSKAVLIKWKQFAHYDSRTLLGYVVYSIEAPYSNVTMYDGRDACGGDGWRVDDVSAPETSEKDKDEKATDAELHYILTQLKPYTQYAFYVRTYTIATEKIGAQSRIQYFMTFPDTPSVPLALKAISNSSSELVIHWSPPATPNGNVTHYVVTGTWERDDPDFLEQRNYCSEPLVVMEKKPIQTTMGEDPEYDDSENWQSGLDRDKCDCQKDDKAERIKQKEKETQFQIHFEDALHNQVYVKRTQLAGRYETDEDSRSSSSTMIRPPREKREISYREQKGLQGNHFPDTLEREKLSASAKSAQSKNRVVDGVYVNFEQIVWTGNDLVIRNLRHFALYTISVMACRERISQEPQNDKKNCSAQAIVSARTQLLDTADDVFELSVQVQDVSNHSLGEVLLKWEEPVAPNGLIVTYQIEYRRVDIENFKPTVECITRRQFQNKSNSYTLKNLGPGNYSVRLRATSLADNGKYTPIQYFYIKEVSTVQPLYVLMVTLLAIFILVGIMCLMVFYLRRHIVRDLPNRKLIASVNPEYVSTVYVPDEWEVPRKQIELLRELGQGSFGMVYEGIARDVVPDHPIMSCAIKTVNENATDRERIEFLNEASVMKAFNTHHVVRLLGVVSEGQPTLVVMELMANGDLKTYLRSHRPDITDEIMKHPPSLRRILQMAIEIADGMAYLAAKKFVHRDLAARNCMVAEDLTVKIGDFGMTRDIYETDYYRKGTKGLLPVRWMAPESLKDGVFTSHSDVWSYGVVLWEMATLASQPYQGLSNDQVLRYVIDGGVMERPDNCPDKLYELMRHCWQHKPSGRPSFLDLVSMLLTDVNSHFASVSFYHSEEGVELRGVGAVGGEETPLRVTREIEDFSLGSDDEDCYKQPHSSGSSKVSNGSTTPTPNGYIVARPNGNTAIKFTKY